MPSADQKTTALVPVWLYVLFFLSGISGLMYEVVWVRMLTRVLGSTVYATSTVLAAFMAGLALGSYLAGRWIDRSLRPLAWYVGMEIGVGLSALATLGLPVRLLSVYRWIFEIAGGSRGWLTGGQVAIGLPVLLVPTALMGATLPALCAQVVRCRGSLGPGLARLYGINTLGGVVGVLAAGFVLLGELGETSTVLIGAGLNVAVGFGGIAMLRGLAPLAVGVKMATTDPLHRLPATSPSSEQNAPYSEAVRRSVMLCFAANGFVALATEVIWARMLVLYLGSSRGAISLVALSLVAGMVLTTIHPSIPTARRRLINWGLTGATVLLAATAGDSYYRLMRRQMNRIFPEGLRVYRHVEHAAGTTTSFGSVVEDLGAKQLWVNGHGMTALVTATKVMAHLPIWLAQDPREVLVVCFGMGTTVRSALRYPDLQVWAVELVPDVVDCFGFYHSDGPELLKSPNLHVVVDDGRNFLLMHKQQFDVITVDPPPPLYSAGTVNLYNREFFQLCPQRMRTGGAVCVWLPPTNWTEAMMFLRTFVDVFEYSSLWGGPDYPGFYRCGSDQPRRDILKTIQQAYADPAILADLNEWDPLFDQPEKFLYFYLCDGQALKHILRDVPMITDDRPYTEFPLWRACFDHKHYPVFLNALELKYMLSGSPSSD